MDKDPREVLKITESEGMEWEQVKTNDNTMEQQHPWNLDTHDIIVI